MSIVTSYQQLRSEALEAIDKKRPSGKFRAVLGYSICSVSVGANDVLISLQETVKQAELDNIIIETTGCIGMCCREPLLDIYTPEGEKYTYEYVNQKMARAIIISHSMYDEPINEWLIKL
ncbi:(2Fe-2S) ferredoxin domain-containing protein [Clostridiaceae bacterium M8S5]|nr:(2Fe-2S) ferredoxin domain-containing protein [Clostridiaceae bacterium M8S5]